MSSELSGKARPHPLVVVHDPGSDDELKRKPIVFPGRLVVIPTVMLLGYVAMLVSGYSTGFGPLQSLPLYIYCSLLLLYFQTYISVTYSAWRLLYIFLSSSFVVVFAAEILYNTSPDNFTRSPYTYIVINVLLVVAFFAGGFQGRDTAAQSDAAATRRKPLQVLPARAAGPFYTSLAARAAGLAILFYISAFLLDTMNKQVVLRALHLTFLFNRRPYVTVDVNHLFKLHLPGILGQLEGLNLILGLLATAVALLGMAMVGALEISSATREAPFDVLRRSLKEGWIIVRPSLQLVLGPLVWLVPAFSAGLFSEHVVTYLNMSASVPNPTLLDLINPLSRASWSNFGQGALNTLLGALALGAVIVTVLFVDADRAVLRKTFSVFANLGLVIAATLAFFLYSLALLNLVVVLTTINPREPFQVGVPGLFSLIAAIGFSIYGAMRARDGGG